MILAIDIGNTSASFAILKGKKIIREFIAETPGNILIKEKGCRLPGITAILKEISINYAEVNSVILCSVVPAALKKIQSAVRKEMGINPLVIGSDVSVPIKNNYSQPDQVGQDRLVCAYAAKYFYGAPVIIVDFGTAITFDVVSSQGEYDGGIIVPGIRLSIESLSEKTALLPKINPLHRPVALIGRETCASISSGIFFGYGEMCCRLIDLLSDKIKGQPKVIVTGGDSKIMKKYISRKIDKFDSGLIFKGMLLVHNKNFSS